MKTIYCTLILIMGFTLVFGKDQQNAFYNVKNFGATGNGRTDDLLSIQRCIDSALKQNKNVYLPAGTYNVSNTVKVNLVGKKHLVIVGDSTQTATIKCADKLTYIIYVVSPEYQYGGEIKIKGITVEGNNIPYSANHPYINKADMGIGILVHNLSDVQISNVNVKNVYGQGIQVTASTLKTKLEDRADNVSINNCKILNCWGFHPQSDDYGDGIYIAFVKKASIDNNTIKNDLNVTKQYGRAGIVLEYQAENCHVAGNNISGYDRNIHIEADLGGHQIVNNTLTGTDLGILVYGAKTNQNHPLTITGNAIDASSNYNAKDAKTYRSVRGGIVFQGSPELYNGSVIQDNKINMAGKKSAALNIDKNYRMDVKNNRPN